MKVKIIKKIDKIRSIAGKERLRIVCIPNMNIYTLKKRWDMLHKIDIMFIKIL